MGYTLVVIDSRRHIDILRRVFDMQIVEVTVVLRVKRASMTRLNLKVIRQAYIAGVVRLPSVLVLGAVKDEGSVGCSSAARLCPNEDLWGN